jgi:mRNA deadenylase 3'-5' endonuclease subunit Ccr4
LPFSVIVLCVFVSANNKQAMKKQKSKSTKKHTSKSNNKPAATLEELGPSWVDDLDWLQVLGEESTDRGTTSTSTSTPSTSGSHDISILSWNVLADAYCTFRSHPHLPLKFQRHVFDRPQRQHHVRRTLKRLAPMTDLMALQEVDSPLEVQACMQELGYQGLQTPTSAGGNDGRVDSCALYWNSKQYTLIEHEIVRFDDIAIMCTATKSTSEGGKTIQVEEGATSSSTMTNNLSGVQSSFCRKNMGLLVRLKHEPSNREIVVAVVHLYWNPVFEYVKVRLYWSMHLLLLLLLLLYDGLSGRY